MTNNFRKINLTIFVTDLIYFAEIRKNLCSLHIYQSFVSIEGLTWFISTYSEKTINTDRNHHLIRSVINATAAYNNQVNNLPIPPSQFCDTNQHNEH